MKPKTSGTYIHINATETKQSTRRKNVGEQTTQPFLNYLNYFNKNSDWFFENTFLDLHVLPAMKLQKAG
jgi:hypothetical protein